MGVISLFTALSMSNVVIVTPIASISPIVTLVLAHIFLNKLEQVTKWIVLGTSLAVLGIIMVIIGSTL
jgi:drug/metabolite transporter (DMT)-like permease